MLRNILLFFLLSLPCISYAQETLPVSARMSANVSEKFNVLKSNTDVKTGMYRALYKKKTVIAAGNYNNGKRTGMWHFYDLSGKPVQHYNYDSNQILYEVAPDTSGNIIQYAFDKNHTDTDLITRPIRIGGIYYGLAPYIRMFKIEPSALYSNQSVYGVLELLVSPSGRLAECKLTIREKRHMKVIDSYLLDIDLLTDYDKMFIPATINHEDVASTMYVYYRVSPDWKISAY